MIRLFTQAFFRMTRADQAAVVDSVIRDLKRAIGRHVNPDDDRKTEKQIERIQRRAIEHGVRLEHDRTHCRRLVRRSEKPLTDQELRENDNAQHGDNSHRSGLGGQRDRCL